MCIQALEYSNRGRVSVALHHLQGHLIVRSAKDKRALLDALRDLFLVIVEQLALVHLYVQAGHPLHCHLG